MHIVGAVHETGGQQMRHESFEYTFTSTGADGMGPRGLAEVWRCETIADRLGYVVDYFFCPEVVAEVADAWRVPAALHGYR